MTFCEEIVEEPKIAKSFFLEKKSRKSSDPTAKWERVGGISEVPGRKSAPNFVWESSLSGEIEGESNGVGRLAIELKPVALAAIGVATQAPQEARRGAKNDD